MKRRKLTHWSVIIIFRLTRPSNLLERKFGGEIMFRIQRKFVESCLLILLLITLFVLGAISTPAQEPFWITNLQTCQ